MTITRRTLGRTALDIPALLSPWPRSARAQDGFAATRPVHLLLAFGTVTGADVLPSDFSVQLATEVGQPVIVQNATNGTGAVAIRSVGRALSDGHTLFLGALGNEALRRRMTGQGSDTVTGSPAELAALMECDHWRWDRFIAERRSILE